MGSISNSLSGLSFLTQPGGPLSNLPAPLSTAELQSAPAQDLVSLSMSAIQEQNVNELFGISPPASDTLPALPITSQQTADILPGVSAADLTNATPEQQSAINDQALLLQQVQALFGLPTSTAGTTNVLA
ncbi:hypothetical protein SBA3_1630012 [Candidatus Sulfopaludibacter sp. SbA3]|nr:hypothetical protein SBA3_1630012 [Candidatus Sulfopaludibacter sp. SbA3]